MKRSILISLFALFIFTGFAQKDSGNNYVNSFATIPAFKINIVPDSSLYTNDRLVKGKPVMIMFFSPDCDHCQHQTKEMLAYKKELQELQIVMVSALPYNYNKDFYEEYELASMPNLKMGVDITYKLRQLYRLTTFPAMYIYDKNGNLAKAFVGNIPIPAILDAIK